MSKKLTGVQLTMSFSRCNNYLVFTGIQLKNTDCFEKNMSLITVLH